MSEKGDFTADRRLLLLSGMTLGIGGLCAGVAWLLLRLIGFFTNLFFYGRLSLAFNSPAEDHLGAWGCWCRRRVG
jgi:hypothetical protein